jgi:RND family efflux transporter MFP subunit
MIRTNSLSRGARWSLALLFAVLLAAGAWALATNGSDPEQDPSSAEPMGGMDMGGMNMSSDGSARLTTEQIQQFGVTFGSVEERTIAGEIRTVGIVNFDETRVANVTPKFGGYVERLHVDFTGQPVRRGQPLLELYSQELVAAQEELLLARRLQQELGTGTVPGVPAGSTDLVAAARRRLRQWDISDGQIEQVLSSGQPLRTLTLHAPVSGIVIEKNVLVGQAVQAGQAIYTIADLNQVWVEAELRESEAGFVQEGATATVELAAFPGRLLPGRVSYIYPTLQEQARTLKARIALANPDGRLKPGMFATVRIQTPAYTALTVPVQAVVNTGQRKVVFVDMGGGRLMPHEVETGRTAGEDTEILAGLEPGQRVVTSAQYLLDSESNLAETMKAMIGTMGAGAMDGMDMSGGAMEDMDMQGADMRGMDMPAAGK